MVNTYFLKFRKKWGLEVKIMEKKTNMIQKIGSRIIKAESTFRKFVLYLFVVLFMAATAMAENGNKENEKEVFKNNASGAKELSGMSIIGNNEAPKSLYIVPWKSSEIGDETRLSTMLNESDMPVDREIFKRQLEFYRISTADKTR